MQALCKSIQYPVSLFSIRSGDKRPRSMIVHHGLMGSSKNFRSLCKHPSISNYVNTHLIDCRNHGNSPSAPTHTMEDLADDLNDYIRKERQGKSRGWEKVTLMGHSMGALALMALTKKYPELQEIVQRIIIIDICACRISEDVSFQKTSSMLERMSTINLQQKTSAIYRQIEEYANSPQAAGLMKSNIIYVEGENHRWLPNLKVIVDNISLIGKFRLGKTEWRGPVEVISGSESPLVDQTQVRLFCEGYPAMKQAENFHEVEGAGHWVHFDNTVSFLQIVEAILRKDS